MDQLELLGYILQNLRDDHDAEEEDLGPEILRETTKIFGLVVQHGHLSRDMFDLKGVAGSSEIYGVPERYASYQTTNYPAGFVCFAHDFERWLLRQDTRDELSILDLVEMIKEWSSLCIQIKHEDRRTVVSVRSERHGRANTPGSVLVSGRR